MAEYIDRQAAIDEIEEWYELYPDSDAAREALSQVKRRIKKLPPAKVRPVVLCDECRWFNDAGYPNMDPEMPELRMGYCCFLGRSVQACWFCATGDRKGGDAE